MTAAVRRRRGPPGWPGKDAAHGAGHVEPTGQRDAEVRKQRRLQAYFALVGLPVPLHEGQSQALAVRHDPAGMLLGRALPLRLHEGRELAPGAQRLQGAGPDLLEAAVVDLPEVGQGAGVGHAQP